MSDHLFLTWPSFSALPHREKRREKENILCPVWFPVTFTQWPWPLCMTFEQHPTLASHTWGPQASLQEAVPPQLPRPCDQCWFGLSSLLLKSCGMCHRCLTHLKWEAWGRTKSDCLPPGLQTSWNWCIFGTWITDSMVFSPHWPTSPPRHLSPFLLSSA